MRQGTFTSLVILGLDLFQLNLYQKFPNFLAVKIDNLFAATVALFGAGKRTLKHEFFERPGKNL